MSAYSISTRHPLPRWLISFKKGVHLSHCLLFLDLFYFYYVFGVLPECVCAPCACSALGGRKGAPGTVELELWMALRIPHVGYGNWTWVIRESRNLSSPDCLLPLFKYWCSKINQGSANIYFSDVNIVKQMTNSNLDKWYKWVEKL